MLLKPGLEILARLPLSLLYLFAHFFYYLVYYVLRYRRRVVTHNLTLAFPDKTQAQHRQISKTYYKRLCNMIVENLKLSRLPLDKILNMVELADDFPKLPKDKSAIVLTAHLFNWELILLIIAQSLPTAFVYKQQQNKLIDAWMLNIRRRFGSKPVEMRSTGNFIRLLRKKEAVYYLGVLADQSPAGHEAKYWINFFNHPTPFLKGIAKLSSLSECSVYFCEMAYLKRGKYKMTFKHIGGASGQLGGRAILGRYARYLEAAIRADPANWLWTHKRWKHSKPEDVAVIGD